MLFGALINILSTGAKLKCIEFRTTEESRSLKNDDS